MIETNNNRIIWKEYKLKFSLIITYSMMLIILLIWILSVVAIFINYFDSKHLIFLIFEIIFILILIFFISIILSEIKRFLTFNHGITTRCKESFNINFDFFIKVFEIEYGFIKYYHTYKIVEELNGMYFLKNKSDDSQKIQFYHQHNKLYQIILSPSANNYTGIIENMIMKGDRFRL
jgi:hypothetical protein